MDEIPATLQAWSYEAIVDLLEAHCFEDARFDWKCALPSSKDDNGKDRLVQEAVGMANSGGAFIVFGIADKHDRDPKQRIRGLPPDQEFNHKLQHLLKRADPAVPFLVKNPPISIPNSKLYIQVVQILPRSAPHSFKSIFYRRTTGGSAEPMTTHQVRDIFSRQDRLILEAPILQDIRRIEHNLQVTSDWELINQEVAPLRRYAMDGSATVRLAVLEALNDPCARVRSDMPAGVALHLTNIIWPAIKPGEEKEGRIAEEEEILLRAAEHGRVLAYDGALYLRNGTTVWAGAIVLAEVLCAASGYELPKVVSKVRQGFKSARDGAERSHPKSFREAIEWLRYKEEDALARSTGRAGLNPPDDLEYRLLRVKEELEETSRWRTWKRRLRQVQGWVAQRRGGLFRS